MTATTTSYRGVLSGKSPCGFEFALSFRGENPARASNRGWAFSIPFFGIFVAMGIVSLFALLTRTADEPIRQSLTVAGGLFALGMLPLIYGVAQAFSFESIELDATSKTVRWVRHSLFGRKPSQSYRLDQITVVRCDVVGHGLARRTPRSGLAILFGKDQHPVLIAASKASEHIALAELALPSLLRERLDTDGKWWFSVAELPLR